MTKKEKEMVISALLFIGCTEVSYTGKQDFVGLAIKLAKEYDIKDLRKSGLELCEDGEDPRPEVEKEMVKNYQEKSEWGIFFLLLAMVLGGCVILYGFALIIYFLLRLF